MGVVWKGPDSIVRRGPSWDELVDEAARMLGIKDPELLRMRGSPLQILEYFLAKKGSFAPLTNWLHLNMQPPDDSLQRPGVHTTLASLDRCSAMYTTNYDNFLERALRLAGRSVRVVASERDMGHANTAGGDAAVEVVKFHGDFNHPEAMVLSERHYEERIRLRSALDLKLRSDILGRAILFIGYSFRDWNVAYLFRLANEEFGPLPGSFSGKRAYIIVSNPSDFEMQLFHNRNIEVVTGHGSDHGANAVEVLRDMAS
jgi:SIR2-like domain